MKKCKNINCRTMIEEHLGRGRPQDYCEECAEKIQKEKQKQWAKEQRRTHSSRPSYLPHEPKWVVDEYCGNCGVKTHGNVEYDEFHGDAICKGCGLIVGRLYI